MPIPFKYLWTWDHSTNWNLNADGQLDWGCRNAYLKSPETFLADYKTLIDYASSLKINGIVIYGFLRDSHGGIDFAKEIVSYAKERDIEILPGVGTSGYGGFYYEGNHEFNIRERLKKYPDTARIGENGEKKVALCPSHTDNISWLKEGVIWLVETFGLNGMNLENGDFMVCHCDRCCEIRRKMAEDREYYKDQYLSYLPVLEALEKKKLDRVMYVPYTGFVPKTPQTNPESLLNTPFMQENKPVFAKNFPDSAICQWTLTGMLRNHPVFLDNWLNSGTPSDFYENQNWPKNLCPPTKRNAGFVHQGSQWHRTGNGYTRYSLILSEIKEACLRAGEADFEALCIHGEVSSHQYPQWDINYRAFAYFAENPDASLKQFAKFALSPVLGGKSLAETFIEWLAKYETGKLKKGDFAYFADLISDFQNKICKGDKKAYDQFRYWQWLLNYIGKGNEKIIKYNWEYFPFWER